MNIIKLGGSVITDKTTYATLNEPILESLSRELAGSGMSEPMIMVHGAGPFGHILAKEYELKDPGDRPDLAVGIARVQRDVRELNLSILNFLGDHGIPAVSIPPSICSLLDDGKLRDFDVQVFKRHLELGAVPVTFGDVVPDVRRGVSILSGDTIMERLIEAFHPGKAIFVLDVDGFYDRPPTDPDAALYGVLEAGELEEILKELPLTSKDMNNVVDITGSIRGKMESALRIARAGTDTYLVNGRDGSRIRDILEGRPTITTMIKGVR